MVTSSETTQTQPSVEAAATAAVSANPLAEYKEGEGLQHKPSDLEVRISQIKTVMGRLLDARSVVFEVGDLLTQAKDEFGKQDYEVLLKKTGLRSTKNANNYIRVAASDVLRKTKFHNHLPVTVGALIDLVKWTEEEIRNCIKAGVMHPDATRAELSKWKKPSKETDKLPVIRLVPTRAFHNDEEEAEAYLTLKQFAQRYDFEVPARPEKPAEPYDGPTVKGFRVSDRTREILRNFREINPSIMFYPGNVLKTVSPVKDVFAKATVAENFPIEFAIFDIRKFLGALKTTDNVIKTFRGDVLALGSKGEAQYTCASPNMIISAPADDIDLPSNTIAEFEISEDVLKKLKKASKAFQGNANDAGFVVQGDGTSISIEAAFTAKDTISDGWKVELGPWPTAFKATFKADKINKLIDGHYRVTIANGDVNGIYVTLARFETAGLTYIVATEEKPANDN